MGTDSIFSKPVVLGDWRYYGYWINPGFVHLCGPRGGGSGTVYDRKKVSLKNCPKCGTSVPEELRMLIKLQRLKKRDG